MDVDLTLFSLVIHHYPLMKGNTDELILEPKEVKVI